MSNVRIRTIFSNGCAMMALLLMAAGGGCGSDDKKPTSSSSGGYTDHSSPYPTCDQIIKACHPYDIGEGTIHDCHDQGHEARSEADCTPVKDLCLSTCAAAADAGAADGSTDGATR